MRDLSPSQKRQIVVQGWTNKQTQIATNKVTKGDEGSPSLPKESDLWTNDSTGVDIRQTIIQTNKQTQNKGDKRGDEVVRFPNPLAFESGLGERTPKKEVF